ncbi:hypothetical protein [Ancylobacter polymorphus]|uniref:Uncharacterized protein n=1 Tax=Ancylobacter polymorphus TaxID=223390 RepID=A0A9E7D6H2_9HYPH|nr:hypothetical protein [Ancylobacter polymorphus]UOK72185.1 hypothetical protein K9D25_05555 [Ancylobacter polymorphus]
MATDPRDDSVEDAAPRPGLPARPVPARTAAPGRAEPAPRPEAAPREEAASPVLAWLAAPPTHPQEMKAAGEIRLGPLRLAGGARMTPAAVLAAGVCTGLILMGVAAVVRAGRR